jgi:molecular chaperone DnaK
VTFDIDANGILKVTAQDKASGRSQNITITASSGLAKDEVERMRKEAEAHAAEDKKRRDLIDARNTADNSIYGAEKILGELGEKVPGEIKTEVQAAVEEVKKVKEGDDEPSIRKAVDSLSQVVQKVGAAAYHEQAAPPAGGESGPQQAGPNVVDGETKDA